MATKFYGSVNDQAKQINDLYKLTTTLESVTGNIRSGGIGNVTAFDGNTFFSYASSRTNSLNYDYLRIQFRHYYQGGNMYTLTVYYTDGTNAQTMGSYYASQNFLALYGITASSNPTIGTDYIDLTMNYVTTISKLNKLYGPVNGEAKLIYQGFGHLDYT